MLAGWISRASQRLAVPARHYSAAAAAATAGTRVALVVPSAALGAYLVLGDQPKRVAFAVSVTPLRLARDAWTAGAMLADYQWSCWGLEGARLEEAREGCHSRGAVRLLNLCFKNSGIYIKLGQHVGMLDHLLPSAYVLTMREHLLDRCPVSTPATVRKIIQEDLGAPLESIFSEFDPVPVASASLAQVHRATDAATGREVAVKVQHRGLRETSALDLATIEALVRMVKFFAPGADFMWLVEEANENLPRELDFRVEAANSQRCAANLASSQSRTKGRVVVPAVHLSRSSSRVLTMEFIHGCKVTDKAALAQLGADPRALARLISETFSEMIFTFGDVHADPHAANMMVRAAPPGSKTKWQLVLLDHGLYRQLSDEFRLEYAALWRSLIFADVAGIERSARAMNAGSAVPLFAGLLTQRPWAEVSKRRGGGERLRLKYTAEERDEIQRYAGLYVNEIGALLARVPRALLLLLKTNDCLRAVDAELGAGVSSYVITARECERALFQARRAANPGWRTAASTTLEAAQLEARLLALRVLAWLAPLQAWMQGASPPAVVEEALAVAAGV